MLRQISKTVRYACMLISLVVFFTGWLLQDINIFNISILLMWTNNFLYCIEKPESRVTQLAFSISFFAFLLARPVAELITVRVNYHQFRYEILQHTCVCLYISIVTLHIFEYLFDHVTQFRSFVRGSGKCVNYNDKKTANIRKVALIIFYFTYPFAMLIIIEKIFFVKALGYVAYYTDYASRFPYLVTKIGDMAEIALFVFLATMPLKKECRLPLLLYTIQALAALFTGKRGRFVIPCFIIVIYLVLRNRINNGNQKWFTKKMAMMVLIALPFIMGLLYIYSSVRMGKAASSESFIDRVTGILNETGFSVNIINYEKKLENELPFRLYSLGDTIDYIRENIVVSKLFDIPLYKNYTAGKALNCYSFPHIITYYFNARYYLSGRGLGSCYIAEAYHDGGYVGVVIWNIIYAFILKIVLSTEPRGILFTTLGLLSMRSILLAPRNMASAFLTEWISLDNWLVIILIFAIASLYARRRRVLE